MSSVVQHHDQIQKRRDPAIRRIHIVLHALLGCISTLTLGNGGCSHLFQLQSDLGKSERNLDRIGVDGDGRFPEK
jgi:hypothetical protein